MIFGVIRKCSRCPVLWDTVHVFFYFNILDKVNSILLLLQLWCVLKKSKRSVFDLNDADTGIIIGDV